MEENFQNKMDDFFYHMQQYCVKNKFGNLEFLDGLICCIIILYNEQSNDKERKYFKDHVEKMLKINYLNVDEFKKDE